MSLSLRLPQFADYEAIASWVPDAATCIRWAGARVAFPFDAAELPMLLFIAGCESYCLAEGEGAPLAFGQHWVLTPGAVHLGRIIVSPAARGRGVGRVLCQQLIGKAVQATGARVVTLRARRTNAAALALYTRLGFTPDETESAEDVVFMRMRLAPAGF